jgi:hypothetical protein
MNMKKLLLFICVCLLMSAGTANAADGDLMWSSSTENDTDTTNGGGAIINGPSTYVSGAVGNAFAGNASVYAEWGNTEVAAIFDAGWDNDAGFTIDLYFRGDHWDTHSGDSGLWSVTDRFGGDPDGYIMVSVRDGKLRFPLKDSYSDYDGTQLLSGVTLVNDTTYHLVAQQLGTDFEVFLNGTSVYTATLSETIAFPEFNDGSHSGSRDMRVGSRAVFGGELQSGEWVDEINVYNGTPEPATIMMLGLGGLALIRRRKA